MAKAQKQYPTIKGLTWHRHPFYSFFLPLDWHRFAWPDDRQGEIYGPDPHDPFTTFSISLTDLGTWVTPDDLVIEAEGFFDAIAQLPAAWIGTREQKVAGQMLELEARYVYSDAGKTRKCWTRVFYTVTRQITMTAQGSTPETYDYWLPIFFEAMMTANIHSEKSSIELWK
ncbi:MAG: hypothetical protein GXY36_07950 [Chloroflexi bacterium]|nr:hypothetical protein [Chloroflexota bacterium]